MKVLDVHWNWREPVLNIRVDTFGESTKATYGYDTFNKEWLNGAPPAAVMKQCESLFPKPKAKK